MGVVHRSVKLMAISVKSLAAHVRYFSHVHVHYHGCDIAICGDGITVGTEECDQGYPPADGGGCSKDCTIEDGFTCDIRNILCYVIFDKLE